jgi:hypothetical protein
MGEPSVPQSPYTYGSQANNIYGSTINSQYNLANRGNTYTNNILSNPYAGTYQAGANSAGSQYGALAPLATGAASSLYGAGNQALASGNEILQAGFDPQNQLYAQVQNQNQQQNLAQLASLGVAGTPYGGSVASQANTNFNLDWQNNQLQREATAASAYSGLNNTAQSDYAAGYTQGQGGANASLMAGNIPYATTNAINQNDLSAIQGQQGLYGTAQSGAANYLNSSWQAQNQQYNNEEQQYQSMMSGIGSLLGMGTSMFGGMGMFGQLGAFSNLFGGSGGGSDVGVGTYSGYVPQ